MEWRGFTLLWCHSVMILHISTLSALYFAVTVYVLSDILYCSAIKAVFLTNDPQKAKVTQKQNINGSCTFTSISAIHWLSHVEVGSYGELTLFIIIYSFLTYQDGKDDFVVCSFWMLCCRFQLTCHISEKDFLYLCFS